MRTQLLTRAEVVGAVEAGIRNSPDLPLPVAQALRNVALTTDRIGVGVFCAADGCVGCPMTEAAITDKVGALTPLAKALGMDGPKLENFTECFDQTIDGFIAANGGLSHAEIIEVR